MRRLITNFIFPWKILFQFWNLRLHDDVCSCQNYQNCGINWLFCGNTDNIDQKNGVQLEKGPFEGGGTTDFLWMMMFGALSLLVQKNFSFQFCSMSGGSQLYFFFKILRNYMVQWWSGWLKLMWAGNFSKWIDLELSGTKKEKRKKKGRSRSVFVLFSPSSCWPFPLVLIHYWSLAKHTVNFSSTCFLIRLLQDLMTILISSPFVLPLYLYPGFSGITVWIEILHVSLEMHWLQMLIFGSPLLLDLLGIIAGHLYNWPCCIHLQVERTYCRLQYGCTQLSFTWDYFSYNIDLSVSIW